MPASRPTESREEHRVRFTRDTLITLGLVVLFAIVGALFWSALEIFLLAFAGILFGIFLNTPAHFLSSRTSLPHGWSLAITLVVLLALVAAGGWLLGPRLVGEATQLLDSLPRELQQLRDTIRQLPGGAALLERMSGQGSLRLSDFNVVSRVTGTVSTLWDVVAKVIFVFFLGIFLASAPRMYRDGAVRLVPKPQQPRARDMFDELGRTLQWWLLGKLVSMAAIGLLSFIGLLIIGVPMALLLGIVAGLLEFVPILGPLLAFIPAVLVGLSQGTSQALYVAILYIAIQQLESNVITPLVQERAVDLPPAITITAVFVAAAAFGLLGVLVATPLAAVALVLVKILYLHETLHESVDLPRDS